MNKYEYWRGQYRTISYEVCHAPHGWTAYIYLRSEMVKLHYGMNDPKRPYYTFDDEPIMQAVSDVVNGGVTLYEVSTNPGVDGERYKVGWDYQHIWDDGRLINENRIEQEAKSAIDALWAIAPDMKVHCGTVGGYHAITDGYITEYDEFISNAGVAWRQERGWKLPAPKSAKEA